MCILETLKFFCMLQILYSETWLLFGEHVFILLNYFQYIGSYYFNFEREDFLNDTYRFKLRDTDVWSSEVSFIANTHSELASSTVSSWIIYFNETVIKYWQLKIAIRHILNYVA